MAVSLPTFPPLQVHLDGNVGPRWKKWLARLENLIAGVGIEDVKQKRALLLHYSGPEVDEIFDTLEDTDEDKDNKKAVEKLTTHFNPQVNTTYEVFNFREAQQNEDESFDSFHARLRTLAKPGGRNPGGGGTPYNGLYGEAPPERGTLFRLQVCKRVGIPQGSGI